jgi:hypothetical protein
MGNSNLGFPAIGKCGCGDIQYRMLKTPLFVHCCHCTWCQRETGSAFALNALIESENLEVIKGRVEHIQTPSSSGATQAIARCTACRIALWSHYGAAREKIAFVRVGTLQSPALCPPDIHIFTSTKQHWVNLSEERWVVDEYYRRSEYWPPESVARYKRALES